MNRIPLISTIMSVYNSENTIENSIKSILNQSFENFEFIIVDDCSTDSSIEIIKNYQIYDKRVKLFKNDKNIGLTRSLNIAIRHSKGEIVARQDSDDLSSPQRFEVQKNYLVSDKYDLCVSRAINKQNNKKLPRLSYFLPNNIVVKFKNPFIHGTLMIKKKVLNKIGNYNESFYFAQDYFLFNELIKNNQKIKYIKEPLYILNTENNISQNFKKQQDYYAMCIKKNIQPKVNLYK